MSQPPKTTSSRRASGTSSATRGARPSVRLPRRTVTIWVRLPMGRESPLRMASTPAMKVVATAPIPGSRTPSLPSAGGIGRALSELFMTSSPGGSRGRRPKAAMLSQRLRASRRRSRGALRADGGKPAGAGEEVQGGRGQLLVVARANEPPLLQVVVEDARPGEVLLGLERIEHQDPGVARESAVVEEAKREVAH